MQAIANQDVQDQSSTVVMEGWEGCAQCAAEYNNASTDDNLQLNTRVNVIHCA